MGCAKSSEKEINIEEKELYDDGSEFLTTYKMKKGQRVKHGWEISLYNNGKEMCRSFFHEGRQVGESKGWYEDGSRKFVKSYIDGKIVTQTTYHVNGRTENNILYKNDEKHGTSHRWDEGGHLIAKEEWAEGKPISMFMYENGCLCTSRYYIYEYDVVMAEIIEHIKDHIRDWRGYHYIGEREAVFVRDKDDVKQSTFIVKFGRKNDVFKLFKKHFKGSDWGEWKDV
jgi:hypothetical protein